MSDSFASDTESDNGDENGDLKYKRSKSGRVSYYCSWCGHDNIENPDDHFYCKEQKNGHLSYGICNSSKCDNNWFLMNIAPHY